MLVGLHAFKEPVLKGVRVKLASRIASSKEQKDLSILQTGGDRLGPKANQDKSLKANYVSVRNTIPVVQSVSSELPMYVPDPNIRQFTLYVSSQ